MPSKNRSGGASCALALVVAVATASAQPIHPSTLALEGGATVPLAAEAQRSHLLGTAPLYSIAIYTAGRGVDIRSLRSADVAKAVRIHVTYKDDVERGVALDWRKELVPRMEPPAAAHLRGTFAPVRDGDVILVQYVPQKGTTVSVNRAVAASGASHTLMLAFLDHWLGEQPVSESLKRYLLRPS